MKKLTAMFMALTLLCTGLTGCAQKKQEESAVADEVVESTETELSTEQDSPEVVDNSNVVKTPEKTEQTTTPSTEEPEQTTTESPTEEPSGSSNDEPAKEPEQTVESKEYNLKLMTFNVRYTDDENGHSIAERAPRVKATVEQNDPDIVGMQEVVPAWKALLEETMGDQYGIITHYRSESNKEGLSILYKKDRFTFIDEGFFWCSDTPEIESKGWDSQFPRICSWVRLKHSSTGKEVMFFNFHGEYNDEFAEGSCKLILKEAAKYPNAAAFLVGDFNLSTGMAGHTYFASYFDEARTLLSNPTSDVFDGTRPGGYPNPQAADETLPAFDYLFHQEEKAEAVDYIIDKTRFDGYYASDHYAVIGCYKLI